ncbi:MAG: flavin-containing monooxygenase, partial [Solimonas sp.]
MSNPALNPPLPLSAVIVGAGFAGIGMAIALKKAKLDDFFIVEKAADVGGVWRDNHYPGAACDVPSHLYSFSFEPNPRWSYVFARQPEIAAYLRHCADHYDVRRHMLFDSEVESAVYDEGASLWQVTLKGGRTLRSRLLVSGVGQLSRPSIPALPGIDTFQGHSFHSANWDGGYDLKGKRVAVVGTGASAIQFVPEIAREVERLSVFQRSPAWLKERADRPYTDQEKAAFAASPLRRRLHRLAIYLQYESRALAFTRFRSLMKLAIGLPFNRMLKREIADPVLRGKLTPDYPIGCKRILLTSDYLGALA